MLAPFARVQEGMLQVPTTLHLVKLAEGKVPHGVGTLLRACRCCEQLARVESCSGDDQQVLPAGRIRCVYSDFRWKVTVHLWAVGGTPLLCILTIVDGEDASIPCG